MTLLRAALAHTHTLYSQSGPITKAFAFRISDKAKRQYRILYHLLKNQKKKKVEYKHMSMTMKKLERNAHKIVVFLCNVGIVSHSAYY